MSDDGIAAAEIARQIAALKPRVEGPRGVMGYLDSDQRADVNKTFLASTIRGPGSKTHGKKKDEEDERSYWARKKADKTRKLWENLHSEGTVSVENAPAFSSEESDDDDVKPMKEKTSPTPDRHEKKHKKHKKHRKHKKRDREREKRSKTRRSPS
ncbi:hypothetical protein PInf_007387 [Phytophthora infestans]|nr:hypothetical protein PInf_007387 [Phytophthora infestans]